MKSVVWTDVIQGTVYVAGIFIVIIAVSGSRTEAVQMTLAIVFDSVHLHTWKK